MDAAQKAIDCFKEYLRPWLAKAGADKVLDMDGFSILLTLAVIEIISLIYGFVFPDKHDEELTEDHDDEEGDEDSSPAPPIPPPTEIVSLRIYPIKSCRGIELPSTELSGAGLALDRNWMFIDKAKREFLTIRSDPSMTLIDTKLIANPQGAADNHNKSDTHLHVSISGKGPRSITIPAFPSEKWLTAHTTLDKVTIWGEETDAWEYDAATNAMFSEFFGKDVALVFKGPTKRYVAINGREELYGRSTAHHFADVMSVLVGSEASLRDLNRRLATVIDEHNEKEGSSHVDTTTLTIERFRPNIIVRGRDDHPWEEDTWKRIRIMPAAAASPNVELDAVARCARCQVPNVNPDTAEKDPNEPWNMLMQFRRIDKGGPAKWKPCFGMLCIPQAEGQVAVGDRIECVATTNKHLYNVAAFKDL